MRLMKASIIVLTFGVLFGCAKRPSTPNYRVPFISSIIWDSSTSIRGYLSSVTLRDNKVGGYVDNYTTMAIFYDSTGHPTLSGGVAFNGTSLPVPPGSHSAFDHVTQNFTARQKWSVSSGGGVPAISDSISPPSQFVVTFPGHLSDTVSKGSLTITYGNPGVDSVYILLVYEADYGHLLDTSLHGSVVRSYTKTANTGSFTVPSSMFSGFPNAGVLSVYVIADKTTPVTAGGHVYLLRSTTAATSYCHIKP